MPKPVNELSGPPSLLRNPFRMAASAVEHFALKTLPSRVMTSHIPDPEAIGKSKSDKDEAELAHFGKRQQLKVRYTTFYFGVPLEEFLTITPAEELWLRVYGGIDVHIDDHLGRGLAVSRDK